MNNLIETCPNFLEGVLISTLSYLFFFLITRVVRVSLRAPRLIPGSTEHLASPVDR